MLCTIGDGSTRQGEFFEALCFAVQEQLPIVFVVEDNGYGISTPTQNQMPFRIGIFASENYRWVDGRRIDGVAKLGSRRSSAPGVVKAHRCSSLNWIG